MHHMLQKTNETTHTYGPNNFKYKPKANEMSRNHSTKPNLNACNTLNFSKAYDVLECDP